MQALEAIGDWPTKHNAVRLENALQLKQHTVYHLGVATPNTEVLLVWVRRATSFRRVRVGDGGDVKVWHKLSVLEEGDAKVATNSANEREAVDAIFLSKAVAHLALAIAGSNGGHGDAATRGLLQPLLELGGGRGVIAKPLHSAAVSEEAGEAASDAALPAELVGDFAGGVGESGGGVIAKGGLGARAEEGSS